MNPTNERKTRGDLVHQIVTVLVKNNAQVTPDTAWVHDFTELITAHTNAEIAKVLDRLAEQSRLQYYSHGTTDSGRVRRMVEAIQAERAKLKEVK